MIYLQKRLAIPSSPEYSVPQLKMMVREVELILEKDVSVDHWQNL